MSYIKFLQAGQGEAILIHLDAPAFNILVDGGNKREEFREKVLPELKEILSRGETIDLLIITHQDDDHILGILWFMDIMKQGTEGIGEDFVKRYIFNTPHLIETDFKVSEATALSDKRGLQIEKYLYSIDPVKWKKHGLVLAGECMMCGEAKLRFITPSVEALQKYYGQRITGWISKRTELKELPLSDFFGKIALSEKKDRQRDVINGASVSFEMIYRDRHYLFLGDITPEEFELPFEEYLKREQIQEFSLVKLAHHGSRKNTTMRLAAHLRSKCYVICTDGNNHELPDKMTIAKLLSARDSQENISFLFNYDKPLEDLRITAAEQREYGFCLQGPNAENGYMYVME